MRWFPRRSSSRPIPKPALGRSTVANRVPGVPLFLNDLNCHCYDPNNEFVLNPAAWSDPAPGQWGTAAAYYDDYRGYRRPGEQLAFGRTFKVRERFNLEFQAMFFNAFNRTFLNNPDSTNARATLQRNANGTTLSGFGRINTGSVAVGPRDGVLSPRIQF